MHGGKKHKIMHFCNICILCQAFSVCTAFLQFFLWNANWFSCEMRAEKEFDPQFLKLFEILI